MSKKNKEQPLLPAAQDELDQKFQQLERKAYHAEAYGAMELISRGMKMQAIREAIASSEILEIKGFKNFEEFLSSLSIKKSTGYNLKKIAEVFSEEEFQQLENMGFNQRGMLKLASIPTDMRPDIKNTDDPEELKSQIEDLLGDIKKEKEVNAASARAYKSLENIKETLEKRLPAPDRRDEYAKSRLRQIEALIGNLNAHLDEFASDTQVVWSDTVKASFIAQAQQAQMRIEIFYRKHADNLGIKLRPVIEE